MAEHNLQGIMSATMSNIKEMIDVNSIVGDAITTPDGGTIIPISKVGFGFASGGTDWATKSRDANADPLFGGGSGAGVTITPVAFLVFYQGNVKLLEIGEPSGTVDKTIGMIPELFDKVVALFKKEKSKDENNENDDAVKGDWTSMK